MLYFPAGTAYDVAPQVQRALDAAVAGRTRRLLRGDGLRPCYAWQLGWRRQGRQSRGHAGAHAGGGAHVKGGHFEAIRNDVAALGRTEHIGAAGGCPAS